MGSASFLESVSENFDRVATLLELPSGLAEQIKVANSTYIVRFGVRLRGGGPDLHRLSLCPFRAF